MALTAELDSYKIRSTEGTRAGEQKNKIGRATFDSGDAVADPVIPEVLEVTIEGTDYRWDKDRVTAYHAMLAWALAKFT